MIEEESQFISEDYGAYHCSKMLGATSEGAVYLAHHADKPEEALALRALNIPHDKVDDVLSACKEHIEIVKTLNAPHLIPVLDYGHKDNEFYLVMPFIRGKSLLQKFYEAEHLPSLGEVFHLLSIIGMTLDRIHEQDHVHGMVEPRNILITPDEEFFLADIGLARLMKITFELANTGSFWAGKYSPPEIWEGERTLPQSDQYSLACLVYHLLVGKPPFNAGSILGLLQQHQNELITPPHYLREELPADLTFPLIRATSKDPRDRYRTVARFVEDIADIVEGNEGEPTGFYEIKLP